MHKAAISRGLCLALLASAMAQAQTVAAGARAVVSSDTLAVHAAMSETSEVKATLAKGDTVIIGLVLFGENVTWCAVSKVGQSRRLGFASCEFLEPDRGPTAAVEAAPAPPPVPAQPPVAKSKPKPITIREVPQAPITVREVPSPALPTPVELLPPKPATVPPAATVAVDEPPPAAPPPVTPAVREPAPAAPVPAPVTAREPEPTPAPVVVRDPTPAAPPPPPVTAREPEPTPAPVVVRDPAPAAPPPAPPTPVPVRESVPSTPSPATAAAPVTVREPEPTPPPVPVRDPEPPAPSPVDFVEILLDGSGLRSSLAHYTQNTNLLAFLDKGRLAEIELPTLQHALSRWFKPDAFYAAIGRQVRKSYSPERLPEVVAWLRSPVTTKLTSLERRAFSPDARDELVAFADGLRAAPPSQPRLVLIHRLYESLRTCDLEVETTIALVHTVAQAIGPALPKEKRYTAAELDRALGAVKSRYRSIMKNARIVHYLFAYRTVSDEELEQYVTFLESANGKWLISLVDRGFFDATESISRGLRADIPRNVKTKRGLPGENTAKGLLP